MTALLTKPSQPMHSHEAATTLRASKSVPKEKIGVAVLLLATAALYFWNLSNNDYGNSFYAAAAQAGADNWTAFFFGSSDMANSTVQLLTSNNSEVLLRKSTDIDTYNTERKDIDKATTEEAKRGAGGIIDCTHQ